MEAKLAKIGKWGAQAKVDLKKERRRNQKIIDKSRETKRRLKNMEADLRTPAQEYDALIEAECVEDTMGMENYEKRQLARFMLLHGLDLRGEVFYNSDGESVLFEDMEPV
tara:strand:+ start:2154 stop:2483 length:330 start_codon:yes stop_codon:yes gene_type:complete